MTDGTWCRSARQITTPVNIADRPSTRSEQAAGQGRGGTLASTDDIWYEMRICGGWSCLVSASFRHYCCCSVQSRTSSKKVSKVFPKSQSWAALITVSAALARHQLVLWNNGHGASASCRMSVYFPAEAGTRFSDTEGMQGWVDLGIMGVNSLPKTATRQRHDCDSNPSSSEPESGTLTTRPPSHPSWLVSRGDALLAPKRVTQSRTNRIRRHSEYMHFF